MWHYVCRVILRNDSVYRKIDGPEVAKWNDFTDRTNKVDLLVQKESSFM